MQSNPWMGREGVCDCHLHAPGDCLAIFEKEGFSVIHKLLALVHSLSEDCNIVV